MKVSTRLTNAKKQKPHLVSIYLILLVLFSSIPIVSSLLYPFSNFNQSFVYRSNNLNPIPKNKLSITTPTVLTMSLRAWTCHGRNQRDMVDKLTLVSRILMRFEMRIKIVLMQTILLILLSISSFSNKGWNYQIYTNQRSSTSC